MAPALEITGLARRFHRVVLDRLDLSVAPGRLVAILGASGSGKTTLLRLICGFERPDAGTIAIEGRAVSGPGVFIPPERRRIGYVAQDGALFPHLTVAQNVLFGLPRAERLPQRAADLLRLVGLPGEYGRRPPQHLSGGEQQRVALARALAPGPRLVLLDEPFSALDAALRGETRRAVVGALRQAGATGLLVTHDQGEALSIGDEVAVLRDGRLVQVASPAALYQHPVDVALARFVGDAVVVDGVANGDGVDTPLGVLRRGGPGPDGAVQVMIRPEQIRLLDPSADGRCGTVADVTYYGHDASVRLDLDGAGGLRSVTARVSGHEAPAVGDQRRIRVDGDVTTYAPPPGAMTRAAG